MSSGSEETAVNGQAPDILDGQLVDAIPVNTGPPTTIMSATRVTSKGTGSRRLSRYKLAMQRACTEKDLEEIVGQAVTDAKGGNVAAQRLVLEYLVGKPGTMGGGQEQTFTVAIFKDNRPLIEQS